jgi:hypothetical protein
MPDPMFSENVGMIQDTNYPSSKIVGTWATFGASPVQTETVNNEVKIYFDINSNGSGRIRQCSKNLATGHDMSLEANFRWKYLGANRWDIMLPSSNEYKTTDSNLMTKGNIGARTVHVRYYQGNLYEMTGGGVWVPANRENISEMANRRRQEAPVLRLNLN